MKIIIPGKPCPLKRPRFSKRGKVYNSQKDLMIKNSFIIKSQYNGPILLGPLFVKVSFFMPISKSLSKKKQLKLENTFHDKHVDIDNLEKLCFDELVLAGNIFIDDSQIALSQSCKVWSNNPRTEITLETINYDFAAIKKDFE